MDLLQHELPVHALDFQHKPPVYNSKTTHESIDLASLMIGMQQLWFYQF